MAEKENQKEFFTEIKNEFNNLGSKVNKLFDEIVRGREGEKEYQAHTDIFESEGMVVYQMDLPGFKKSEVTVQIRDNKLVVRGSRFRDRDENVTMLHRERVFGSFERSFTLPAGLVTEQVKAKFEDGILTISLPNEAIEIESTEIEIN